MRSDCTIVERFVGLFMKMDDLHLPDFRKMRLKSKGDFDIAYSAVTGINLDAYLQKLIVFKPGGFVLILRQKNHKSVT